MKLLGRLLLGFAMITLLGGLVMPGRASAADKASIKVMSPADGATVTTTDIPVTVAVANFNLAPLAAGMPDKAGEGHIHVMVDGMTMGVLFNFYTTTSFTLPGTALKPGQHTLIFDLASNTHMDMEDTVTEVKINYQPTTPKAAPAPATFAAKPAVEIVSPKDGATVGPVVSFEVKPTNFNPMGDLEGKPNLAGYGHYHVFVDMDMSAMTGDSHGMMSMAGMVLMPGTNTFSVNLAAWKPGKHVITIEPVQNDHTMIEGAKLATITINLQTGAPSTLPTTGGSAGDVPWLPALLAAAAIAALAGGWLVRNRKVA